MPVLFKNGQPVFRNGFLVFDSPTCVEECCLGCRCPNRPNITLPPCCCIPVGEPGSCASNLQQCFVPCNQGCCVENCSGGTGNPQASEPCVPECPGYQRSLGAVSVVGSISMTAEFKRCCTNSGIYTSIRERLTATNRILTANQPTGLLGPLPSCTRFQVSSNTLTSQTTTDFDSNASRCPALLNSTVMGSLQLVVRRRQSGVSATDPLMRVTFTPILDFSFNELGAIDFISLASFSPVPGVGGAQNGWEPQQLDIFDHSDGCFSDFSFVFRLRHAFAAGDCANRTPTLYDLEVTTSGRVTMTNPSISKCRRLSS